MNLGHFQKRTKAIGIIVFLTLVIGVAVVLGRSVPGLLTKASSCPAENVSAVQVTSNSAVIGWDTTEPTQGKIEYGTSASNLTFSVPETVETTAHNVPLTLLTPNTVYYYIIRIGQNICDSSGQRCESNCVPWSFTTTAIIPQNEAAVPIPTATGSADAGAGTVAPTSTLSEFCRQLQSNLGKSNKDATAWAQFSQYDMDSNGIINGKDIITCIKQGK